MKEKGVLTIKNEPYNRVDYREAVCRYQAARRDCRYLSLVGCGAESALCLMLAGRFQPDEVCIYPVYGEDDAESFFKCVSKCVPYPFFICAPVTVCLPACMAEREIKRMRRLLMKTNAKVKRIVLYEDAQALNF